MNSDKLGLGTVQFGTDYGISNKGGKVDGREVEKILNICKINNIQILDTASAYGDAEKVLGNFDLSEFSVISKFLPNENKLSFDRQLEQTLSNLKIETLYAYLAHRPLELANNRGDWEALIEAKAKGKVRKIGYSLNKPNELDKLIEIGMYPDIVQVPFNYLDRRFEKKLIELKKSNVEIHARSVFLQGLFFINPDSLPNHFEEVKPLLLELSRVTNLSGQLLDYVLSKGFIDKVIIGTESAIQLKNNIESLLMTQKSALPDVPNLPEDILLPMHWPTNK